MLFNRIAFVNNLNLGARATILLFLSVSFDSMPNNGCHLIIVNIKRLSNNVRQERMSSNERKTANRETKSVTVANSHSSLCLHRLFRFQMHRSEIDCQKSADQIEPNRETIRKCSNLCSSGRRHEHRK